MSEQSLGVEMGSPRERAVKYLEMRQNQKLGTGNEKNVKTPIVPDKVRRPEPLVETVTAYEKVIDRVGEKGYLGLQEKLSEFRPAAYDALRLFQWTARAADFALTAAMWVPDSWIRGLSGDRINVRNMGPLTFTREHFLARAAGSYGMVRFRPLEWVGAKAVQFGGAVMSSDLVAPVVNNILRGGERVEKKPLPFSGTKPTAA